MSFRNFFEMSKRTLLHRKSIVLSHLKFMSALPSANQRSKHEYYNILEVAPNSTLTEIREAYFRKVKECHPDINPSPEARDKFLLVREAYKVLADVDRRIGYDRSLHRSGSKVDAIAPESKEEFERAIKRKQKDQEVFEEEKKKHDIGYYWGPREEKSFGAKNIILNKELNRIKDSDREKWRQEARESQLYKTQTKIAEFMKRFDIGGPKGEAEDGKAELEGLKMHVTKYTALFMFLILSGSAYQVLIIVKNS